MARALLDVEINRLDVNAPPAEAVELPPDTAFYLSRDGQTYGPHSLPEIHTFLEEGAVQPGDFVWTDGMEQWVSVGDLLEALGEVEPTTDATEITPEPLVAPAGASPAVTSASPADLLHRHAVVLSEPNPAEADALWIMPGTVNVGLAQRLGVSGGLALLLHLLLVVTMTLGATAIFTLNTESPPPVPAEPAPLEVAFVQEPPDQPPPPQPPPPDTPPPPPPPDPPPPPAPPDIPLPQVMTPPVPPVNTPPPETIPPPSTMPTLPAPPQPPRVAKAEHHSAPPPAPAPMISGPVHVGPSDYLVAPPPEYPFAAKQRREQGAVMLLVQVDGAGYPTSVSVSSSSGYSILDNAAQRQVQNEFRFRVGSSRQLLVPVTFRLP